MKDNRGLISWMKRYPSKALLLLMLIIIPLFVLFLVGYNISRNAKSFYFEKDDDDNPIILYQKDLIKSKDLDKYFENFEIDLKKVSNTKDEDGENISRGRFEFETSYDTTTSYKDANISFRYLLTANWFNEQSNPTSSTTIEFPYNLPKYKYLIFKVNKPILYVEITIIKKFDPVNESNTEVIYYKLDLNNVKYDNVVEN